MTSEVVLQTACRNLLLQIQGKPNMFPSDSSLPLFLTQELYPDTSRLQRYHMSDTRGYSNEEPSTRTSGKAHSHWRETARALPLSWAYPGRHLLGEARLVGPLLGVGRLREVRACWVVLVGVVGVLRAEVEVG